MSDQPKLKISALAQSQIDDLETTAPVREFSAAIRARLGNRKIGFCDGTLKGAVLSLTDKMNSYHEKHRTRDFAIAERVYAWCLGKDVPRDAQMMEALFDALSLDERFRSQLQAKYETAYQSLTEAGKLESMPVEIDCNLQSDRLNRPAGVAKGRADLAWQNQSTTRLTALFKDDQNFDHVLGAAILLLYGELGRFLNEEPTVPELTVKGWLGIVIEEREVPKLPSSDSIQKLKVIFKNREIDGVNCWDRLKGALIKTRFDRYRDEDKRHGQADLLGYLPSEYHLSCLEKLHDPQAWEDKRSGENKANRKEWETDEYMISIKSPWGYLRRVHYALGMTASAVEEELSVHDRSFIGIETKKPESLTADTRKMLGELFSLYEKKQAEWRKDPENKDKPDFFRREQFKKMMAEWPEKKKAMKAESEHDTASGTTNYEPVAAELSDFLLDGMLQQSEQLSAVR